MNNAQLIKAYQETGNEHFRNRLLAVQAASNSNTPAVQTSVEDRGEAAQQQAVPLARTFDKSSKTRANHFNDNCRKDAANRNFTMTSEAS